MASETGTKTATDTGFRGDLHQTRLLLRVVYGLVPIVAGVDKFANVLATWTDYVPAAVAGVLPMEAQVFMYLVGLVEIVAGLVVLSRYTEYGAYLVAGWLTAVAVVLVVGGNFDVAVRDLVMAVGAVALAQLVAAKDSA
ncbi:MAG TPA: DoxX family protein [Halobacteriales archaeon]|nr:DoxX family protein [Halobacteriales archaeon]